MTTVKFHQWAYLIKLIFSQHNYGPAKPLSPIIFTPITEIWNMMEKIVFVVESFTFASHVVQVCYLSLFRSSIFCEDALPLKKELILWAVSVSLKKQGNTHKTYKIVRNDCYWRADSSAMVTVYNMWLHTVANPESIVLIHYISHSGKPVCFIQTSLMSRYLAAKWLVHI